MEEKKHIPAWLAIAVSILTLVGALCAFILSTGRGIEARPTKEVVETLIDRKVVGKENFARINESLRLIEKWMERVDAKIERLDKKLDDHIKDNGRTKP